MEWVEVSHNILVPGVGDTQNNEEMRRNVVGMVDSSGEGGGGGASRDQCGKIDMVMAVWHGMVVQAGVWKRVKGRLDTRVDRRMGPHLDSCAPIPCNVQLEQGEHGAASMSEGQ